MKPSVAKVLVVVLLVAACSATPASSMTPSTLPTAGSAPQSAGPSPSTGPWADDLAQLDNLVRHVHVAPFVIHREAEWSARLAQVLASIESASRDEQIALVSSLIGLLDTHSGLIDIPGGWHFYGLLPYRFSDGWFVIRARDSALVGSRLVAIGGMPIDDVVARLTPLVPHDNPTGLLENVVWLINCVEFLHGVGIVADPVHPAFELQRADGTTVTVDPPAIDESYYDLFNGWLQGPRPEAVARRGEPIWTRIMASQRAFLVSVNDYGDMTAATQAMTAAFDAGKVDRLIFDMRYLQGGSGDIAILDTITADPRINKAGALTVLIGRENVSAATSVALRFDTQTKALLVGEPTPARAGNFTCPCQDLTLPHSGFVVSVPTAWDVRDDPRPEIAPDVPMVLSSTEFFAGRDPALESAIIGITAR